MHALLLLTAMLMNQEQYVAAYHIGIRAAQIDPDEPCVWINLCATCHRLWRIDEAERAFKKGMEVSAGPEARRMLYVNRAALLVDMGRYKESREMAEKALDLGDDNKALENLAMAELAEGNWPRGWELYDRHLKPKRDAMKVYRMKRDYGVPEWSGQNGKVVIYGEQGIGDIISFASIIPDALERADVVIDVEPRLVGLFRRSFDCEVTTNYSGRVDYSCAIGQLGGLFRNNGEFPGTSYLVPCPVRTKMWEQEFQHHRPVVGIAWTGGLPRTGDRFREWTKEDMQPLLDIEGIRWVSLQYKGEPIEGIEEFPWATRSPDYDDTAALVASLDHVICVQTAIAHIAGAVGTPTTMFAAKNYIQWRHVRPWVNSMRVIRQTRSWKEELAEFAEEFKECQLPTPLRRIS